MHYRKPVVSLDWLDWFLKDTYHITSITHIAKTKKIEMWLCEVLNFRGTSSFRVGYNRVLDYERRYLFVPCFEVIPCLLIITFVIASNVPSYHHILSIWHIFINNRISIILRSYHIHYHIWVAGTCVTDFFGPGAGMVILELISPYRSWCAPRAARSGFLTWARCALT